MYVVLTHNNSLQSQNPKTIYSGVVAEGIIKLFADAGYREVCIAGGHETYGCFLKAGAVDDLYIDLEPYMFGKGIHFMPELDLDINFKLLEVSKLSEQTVQLHYGVEK